MSKEEKLKEQIKVLKKERDQFKKAYQELVEFFDCIPDEYQLKVDKKLRKIFKTI